MDIRLFILTFPSNDVPWILFPAHQGKGTTSMMLGSMGDYDSGRSPIRYQLHRVPDRDILENNGLTYLHDLLPFPFGKPLAQTHPHKEDGGSMKDDNQHHWLTLPYVEPNAQGPAHHRPSYLPGNIPVAQGERRDDKLVIAGDPSYILGRSPQQVV